MLALFVDKHHQLLAVDTIARGDISSCQVSFGKILYRGHALQASAFILVHNHPSGDPTPSDADIKLTVRLGQLSRDAEMPMLDHLIIAGDQMTAVRWF